MFCRTRASLRVHKASRHQNCVWYLKMYEIYAIMETMISFSLKIRGDWINGWRKKKKSLCWGVSTEYFKETERLRQWFLKSAGGNFAGQSIEAMTVMTVAHPEQGKDHLVVATLFRRPDFVTPLPGLTASVWKCFCSDNCLYEWKKQWESRESLRNCAGAKLAPKWRLLQKVA